MRILMIIMSIFALTACASAQTTRNNFAIEDLGGGIYVHRGEHLDIDEGYTGDICNISFVVGEKGVAVIDTGGSLKVGQQLRDAIKKVTDKPILYVINTHVHPDHIFGNAAFVEDKPKFIGHDKLEQAMHTRKEVYDKLNKRFLGDAAKGTDIVAPTLTVKTVETIDLGGRTLKITAHPNAHTNTDMTVQDSKTQTLFAGDFVFIERTPVIEGDIKGLIAEQEILKTQPFNMLVPGHGPVQKNNADGVKAINNAQHYFKVLLDDIRGSIKKGESMQSTMSTAAASEKSEWLLFDIANRRNVNNIFPALEWE